MSSFLLYGANGYTGSLIARLARQRGLQPILAGRNGPAIAALANELGLDYRIFRMEDRGAVIAALTLTPLVLHCAGPFFRTAEPMVDGCLRAGVHYLDITGEFPVFEAIAAQDRAAVGAGVMLLPGVGFDVAPTDCLAAHLKRRLPTANKLQLAFNSTGGASYGTQATALEMVRRGQVGVVRRNGRLTPVPLAWKTRTIDFGQRPQPCFTIPWGDVVTAFHSTGIPNIEIYMAAPRTLGWLLAAPWLLNWLIQRPRLQQYWQRRIETGAPGPTSDQRAGGFGQVWGWVEDSAGASAESRLITPDTYTFTALSALAIVEKVLAGGAIPGYQTPATAFGPDWILEIDGVARADV